MADTDKQNYFTAGELANIFGVSKQTLLYYEKMGLFSPACIGENGYRQYSPNQYMDLEVILRLRSLNLSIALIKKYLSNRSKDDFICIMESKRLESEEIIRENEEILKIINSFAANATAKFNKPLKQPLLNWCEAKTLYSTPTTASHNGKDRVMLFTKHSQCTFEDNNVLDKNVGWVVDHNDFLNQVPLKDTIAFFSYAPANVGEASNSERDVEIINLPCGLYVEVYFKGTFYKNAQPIGKIIDEFLKTNSLKPISEIFVLPIESHLLHNDPKDYINKIFLQVQKEE